jgi:hypothetical protein
MQLTTTEIDKRYNRQLHQTLPLRKYNVSVNLKNQGKDPYLQYKDLQYKLQLLETNNPKPRYREFQLLEHIVGVNNWKNEKLALTIASCYRGRSHNSDWLKDILHIYLMRVLGDTMIKTTQANITSSHITEKLNKVKKGDMEEKYTEKTNEITQAITNAYPEIAGTVAETLESLMEKLKNVDY